MYLIYCLIKKTKLLSFFFFLIRIFTFFYCFSNDSVYEQKNNELSFFKVFTSTFIGITLFVIRAYTVNEICYNNIFDIIEVFDDSIINGFIITYKRKKHY